MVCLEFASSSLAKMTSRHSLDGIEYDGIVIHDLHLDDYRHEADQKGETKEWNRRLMTGRTAKDGPFTYAETSFLLEKLRNLFATGGGGGIATTISQHPIRVGQSDVVQCLSGASPSF